MMLSPMTMTLTSRHHLAGRAGVELLDGLLRRGLLEEQ